MVSKSCDPLADIDAFVPINDLAHDVYIREMGGAGLVHCIVDPFN